MKILLVDDDDALLSFLAKELGNRGCDVHLSSSGDEAFHVWQRLVPWELVLTDYRFFPGTKIKDGVQLAAAIHAINAHQQMAMMTADPIEARRNLPDDLRRLPVLRKPFRLEQLLRRLRQPVLPLAQM
jgi:CheY-like chemotaxis protein